MSKTSDILRLRAFAMEVTTSDAREVLREHADVYRALADLLEACVTNSAGYFRCEICGAQASSKVYSECRSHMDDCALAALERAIKGENDEGREQCRR